MEKEEILMELKLPSKYPSFEEWSQKLKDHWWMLNRNVWWVIKKKKTCHECGETFTCKECEYWLCWRSTDFKLSGCICPKCFKEAMN